MKTVEHLQRGQRGGACYMSFLLNIATDNQDTCQPLISTLVRNDGEENNLNKTITTEKLRW